METETPWTEGSIAVQHRKCVASLTASTLMPTIFPQSSQISDFIIIHQSSPGPVPPHQPLLPFFVHCNLNDVRYSRNEIPVPGIGILQMTQNNISHLISGEFSVVNSIPGI